MGGPDQPGKSEAASWGRQAMAMVVVSPIATPSGMTGSTKTSESNAFRLPASDWLREGNVTQFWPRRHEGKSAQRLQTKVSWILKMRHEGEKKSLISLDIPGSFVDALQPAWGKAYTTKIGKG